MQVYKIFLKFYEMYDILERKLMHSQKGQEWRKT